MMNSEVPAEINKTLPMSHFLVHSLLLHALFLVLLLRFAPSLYGSNNGMLRIFFTDKDTVISFNKREERPDYQKAEKAPASPVAPAMTPKKAASPKQKPEQHEMRTSAAIKNEGSEMHVRQADTPYLIIPPVKEEEKKEVLSKPPESLSPKDQPQDTLQPHQATDRPPEEKPPSLREAEVAKPDMVAQVTDKPSQAAEVAKRDMIAQVTDKPSQAADVTKRDMIALAADKPLHATEGIKPVQEVNKPEDPRKFFERKLSSPAPPATIDYRLSDIAQRDAAPAVQVTNEHGSETQNKGIEKEELHEQPANKALQEERADEGSQVEMYRDGKKTVEVSYDGTAPLAPLVAVSPTKKQKGDASKQVTAPGRLEKNDGDSYKGDSAIVIADLKPSLQPEPVSVKEQERAAAEKPGNILFVKPEVYGDIKLELMSEEGSLQSLQVKVLFKEYPKKRRHGPVLRRALKSHPIKPKNVRNLANSVSIVVDNTSEGIYEFIVVDYPGKPLSAQGTLKLYEKKINALSRDLGMRKIEQDSLILRILMPEGVVWDDAAYFSGSIEDSKSVTKYNDETGVIWKEFKE